MSKQELINAIQATITANGQKGITAESLANILIEMVNTAGEGGSGGGSGVLAVRYSLDEDGMPTFSEEDKVNNAAIYQMLYNVWYNGAAALPIFFEGFSVFFVSIEDSGEKPYANLNVAIIADATEDMHLLGYLLGVMIYEDGTVDIVMPE